MSIADAAGALLESAPVPRKRRPNGTAATGPAKRRRREPVGEEEEGSTYAAPKRTRGQRAAANGSGSTPSASPALQPATASAVDECEDDAAPIEPDRAARPRRGGRAPTSRKQKPSPPEETPSEENGASVDAAEPSSDSLPIPQDGMASNAIDEVVPMAVDVVLPVDPDAQSLVEAQPSTIEVPMMNIDAAASDITRSQEHATPPVVIDAVFVADQRLASGIVSVSAPNITTDTPHDLGGDSTVVAFGVDHGPDPYPHMSS
jgi:hypothetical protein